MRNMLQMIRMPRFPILNAMLFTVLGIYDYFEYTDDPDAKLLFDKGCIFNKTTL